MSKHRGEPRRCTTCGNPEDAHHYRHVFTHPAYGTDRTPLIGARA